MAATCVFHPNPTLTSMVINQDNIEVKFKKYTKKYYGVSIELAYKFFYSKQPLKFFNQNIKNQYQNEKI